MKTIEIKLKVLGQIDDMTKELIKDFMRFCTFYCHEENEENKENKENEENQTEEYRQLLERIQKLEEIVASTMLEKNDSEEKVKDIEMEEKIKIVIEEKQLVFLINAEKIENKRNFDIDNQRKILEEILKELEKINPPYSIESMRELMEIYLEYDLFRQGKVIEWYGYKNTYSNANKIADAQNRIISISQRKTDKEREIFRNANVLCGIKRRVGHNFLIEEIKDLYKEVLPSDIAQVMLADVEEDVHDLKKQALDDYIEYIEKSGITKEIDFGDEEISRTKKNNNKTEDPIFLSYLYGRLGKIMRQYTTRKESAISMYKLAIKKNPDNYKAAYMLIQLYLDDDLEIEDLVKIKKYCYEHVEKLENKKEKEPLNIEQVRYLLAIIKSGITANIRENGEKYSDEILKIEDKMCNFIKEYVEDNKFYETFFGKDAQFYRRKTMDYIGLTYIYSYLAIAYRDIKNDMEKSQYYWDLYDEEDARIKNIKETDKIPYI